MAHPSGQYCVSYVPKEVVPAAQGGAARERSVAAGVTLAQAEPDHFFPKFKSLIIAATAVSPQYAEENLNAHQRELYPIY